MERKKKVKKMGPTTNYNVSDLESEMPNPNRVALSKLRDTKEWIPLLEKYNTLEVISGVDTVAQISAPDLVPNLIQQIKLLEQELMNVRLSELYSERAQEIQPLSGEKLAEAASNHLEELLELKGSQLDE